MSQSPIRTIVERKVSQLVLDLLEDACAGLLDELVQFISSNPDN